MRTAARTSIALFLTCICAASAATCLAHTAPQIIGLELPESAIVERGNTQKLAIDYIFNNDKTTAEAKANALAGAKLHWESSNTTVATVDENGFVTAHKAGETDITVKTERKGVSSTCEVRVEVSATGITAQENLSLAINLDGSKPLNAAVIPADATNAKLIFHSSDETVATVDENGIVTGVGSGTCTITSSVASTNASNYRHLSAQTLVDVKTAPKALSLPDISLTAGTSDHLSVTTVPEQVDIGAKFTWSSSNNAVATVDGGGNVRGVSAGTAIITAVNELGQSVSCTLTVKPIVCGYCSESGHTSSYCAKKSASKGALGRWVIPDVGVNVACYESRDQSVCDAKDSAAVFGYGETTLIADHNNQGFSAIRRCKAGTKAYMDTGSGRQEYVCTSVLQGHNTGTQLTDANGNDLNKANAGGFTCYTCNDNWRNITIAFFEPA